MSSHNEFCYLMFSAFIDPFFFLFFFVKHVTRHSPITAFTIIIPHRLQWVAVEKVTKRLVKP